MPVLAPASGLFLFLQSLGFLLCLLQLLLRLLLADEPSCLSQLPAPGRVLPGPSVGLAASLPDALDCRFTGDDNRAYDHQNHHHHVGTRSSYRWDEDACHRSSQQSPLLQKELQEGGDEDKQQEGRPRLHIGRSVSSVGYEKGHRPEKQERDEICTVAEEI